MLFKAVTVETDDKNLLNQVFKLRHTVFVNEQGVPPELERDEFDKSAYHAAVIQNGEVIAAGRLVIKGVSGKIGRMAVKKEWRGKGIGSLILQKLLQIGKEKKITCFYLHAQLQAVPFYRKHGFAPVGEIFEEAGILHQEMTLEPMILRQH
jgi:predicted GNAT family N-acyltransferase